MPTIEKKKRQPIAQGPTGEVVAQNLARIRKQAGVTAEQLVADMAEAGHKLPRTAISDIENSYRKIGVDDLMALSVALNVNPNALLLPNYSGDADMSNKATAVPERTTGKELWAWADGWCSLPRSAGDSLFTADALGRELDVRVSEAAHGHESVSLSRPEGESASMRDFMFRTWAACQFVPAGDWISTWVFGPKREGSKVNSYPSWGEETSWFTKAAQEVLGMVKSPMGKFVRHDVKLALEDESHGND